MFFRSCHNGDVWSGKKTVEPQTSSIIGGFAVVQSRGLSVFGRVGMKWEIKNYYYHQCFPALANDTGLLCEVGGENWESILG